MASNLSSFTPTTTSTFKWPSSFQGRHSEGLQLTSEAAEMGMGTYLANLNIPFYVGLTKAMKKDYLERFDAVDLYMVLQDVKRELSEAQLENYYTIHFLKKNDPKLLTGLPGKRKTGSIQKQEFDDAAATIPARSAPSSPPSPTIMRRLSGQRSIHSQSTVSTISGGNKKIEDQLNYKAKTEMAEKASADVEQKIRALETTAAKVLKDLNAKIEELNYLTEEVKETSKTFHLHFLSDHHDIAFLKTATQQQIERKFRKFVSNWIKSGRLLLGTMRLQITTVQEKCHLEREALIAKTDLSGILGHIDFDQLMIKHTKFQKSLDEKYVHLVGIKGITGKASLAVSEERQQLANIEQKSQKITQKTAYIVKAISTIEKESLQVEEENEKAKKTLRKLKEKLSRFEAPSVNEYIEKKSELRNLEKEDRLLQRKIPILSMKLTNLARKCKNQDDMMP